MADRWSVKRVLTAGSRPIPSQGLPATFSEGRVKLNRGREPCCQCVCVGMCRAIVEAAC